MHLLLALLFSLMLTACAAQSAMPDAPPDAPPATPTKIQSVLDALDKLATNPLIAKANKDAADTLAWINSENGPKDPLMVFKASMCPTAIQLATANLVKEIEVLKGILRQKNADLALEGGPPELVLTLTKKRYGNPGAPGSDLKGLYVMVRHDVFERVDAVVTSCREIVPVKEINRVVELAGQAGITVESGGLAGILGAL